MIVTQVLSHLALRRLNCQVEKAVGMGFALVAVGPDYGSKPTHSERLSSRTPQVFRRSADAVWLTFA